MRRFRVITTSIGARRNRILRCGQDVNESMFYPNTVDRLVKGGYIEEVFIDEHGNPIPQMAKNLDDVIRIYSESEAIKVELSDNTPVLSVVIPYFRAGRIGWLPLESLIRQERVNFNWELFIIEENFDNPFGLDRVLEYSEQLKKAGCCLIKYVSLCNWIPLSAKWHYLIQGCHNDSKVVCFNSSDVYCGKDRLRSQYDVLKKGQYNWYKLSGNLVYDISIKKHVSITAMDRNRSDTACRATTLQLARCLPLEYIKTGVDGWMFRKLSAYGINFFYDESDMWKDTVNVNGLNNISRRTARIANVSPPFNYCCDDLAHHIPSEVVERLYSCADRVADHERMKSESHITLR